MAINVNFYSFTKRENSTKQPLSGATTFSCTLLDNTSLMNPTFKLEISSNPIGYNYCYVADFNRYYFVKDISTFQNFWYISCEVDVLASFKTAIGTGSHYVLRSASDSDPYIVDNIYPAKAGTVAVKNSPSGTDPLAWTNGHSYVVGVIGYCDIGANMIGSITYYHMNEYTLRSFVYYLMREPIEDWSEISTSEFDPAVQKALLNPIQYIVSCMALPISPPGSVQSGLDHLWFGYYDCKINDISGAAIAALPAGSTHTEHFSIAIPKHPDAATRGKYLNGAPFMSYTLHFGPLGDIPIDPAYLIDADDIAGDILYDMIQGTAKLTVYQGLEPDNVLFTATFQCGAELNLSQVLKNPLDRSTAITQGAWETAAGFMTLNIPKTISSMYGTFDSATRSKMQQVTNGGGTTGSLLTFFDPDNLYLEAKYYIQTEENNTELGRPLCKLKQINTLSGFICCSGADCQITGTADEAAKINDFMNNGFFYE